MSTPVNQSQLPSLLEHMVATYKSLRKLLVIVALVFLVLLLAYRYGDNDTVPRYSISAYYHNQGRVFGLLPMRDLYVGTFSAVALMLFAYKGYTWWESRLLNIAAGGLLVVAACPMEWAQPAVVAEDVAQSLEQNRRRVEFIASEEIPAKAKNRADELRKAIDTSKNEARALANEVQNGAQDGLPRTLTGWAHYVGAFVFFIGIACVCWFHAVSTLGLISNRRRERRYRALYRLTSILMGLVPFLAAGLYLGGLRSTVFWIEFAGVGVFILYWSIKSLELSAVQLPPAVPNTPAIRGV